jgi:hypothetical protein
MTDNGKKVLRNHDRQREKGPKKPGWATGKGPKKPGQTTGKSPKKPGQTTGKSPKKPGQTTGKCSLDTFLGSRTANETMFPRVKD